ncbi:hypothetical protein JVU11DRAFT_452 [Chiua virens]|nr:hypothetical protein JVU11DRAFT_452 [Chiua virens]
MNAGLDLEMPGPPRWGTENLIRHCLSSQKLKTGAIDKRVANMLTFVQKTAQIQPGIVFGDGKEHSCDTPEMRKFCRKLAAEGTVLLKNTGSVLPITPMKAGTVAIIGPNARVTVISGSGSAAPTPTYVVSPHHGMVRNAPDGLEIKYDVGCYCALCHSRSFFVDRNCLCCPQISTHAGGLPLNTKRSYWLAVYFYTQDNQGNLDTEVATYVDS